MLAALGPFRFDVTGLPANTINRSTSARWASHDVVSNEPLLEFIGPGTDQVTIQADLFPSALHPTSPAQLAAMRAAVRGGASHMFVLANGDVIGRVIIEKIDESQTHHNPAGNAQKISTTITLKAAGGRTGTGVGWLFTLF